MVNPAQNTNLPPPPVMSLNPGTNTPAKNNPLAAGATGQAADGKASTAKNVADAQDRFLKLLVTQMKNQDPLNPMDNAQVTSQMAQLSTVSGIDKLNSTLQALSGSMLASQSMQASSMIGHVVLVPGNKMELKDGKAGAALDLKQPADNVTVHITDPTGNVVRSLQMGSQPSGIVPIEWDGKNDAGADMPAGRYKFSGSLKLGEEKSSADTLAYGLVNGIAQKASGASLKVEQLGEVGMDAVKQIL